METKENSKDTLTQAKGDEVMFGYTAFLLVYCCFVAYMLSVSDED